MCDVLIVDDDLALVNALQFSLEVAGFSVDSAGSFPDASVRFADCTGIVLLDITMPEISGVEALTIIQKEYPDLPVVMLTGNNNVALAVHCIKLGAFDYLVKPVTNEVLIGKIREYLPAQKEADTIYSPQELCAEADALGERFETSPDDIARALYQALIVLQVYRDATLTLHDLANLIGSNQKTVSLQINRIARMSFRRLLAILRLAAFTREFTPAGGHSMKEAVAAFGFTRYATVCEQCRALMGCTPQDVFS